MLNCEEACPEESQEEQLELFLRTTLFSRRPKLAECLGCSSKRSGDLQGSGPRSISNSPSP